MVAFLDADCAECAEYVRRIAAHAADLRETEAVALLVLLEAPARTLTDPLPQEIIAGSDTPGTGVRAFLGEDALSSRGLARRGVFVIDHYGELCERWIVAGHEVPGPGEILSALDQIEITCEEGTVPPLAL